MQTTLCTEPANTSMASVLKFEPLTDNVSSSQKVTLPSFAKAFKEHIHPTVESWIKLSTSELPEILRCLPPREAFKSDIRNSDPKTQPMSILILQPATCSSPPSSLSVIYMYCQSQNRSPLRYMQALVVSEQSHPRYKRQTGMRVEGHLGDFHGKEQGKRQKWEAESESVQS